MASTSQRRSQAENTRERSYSSKTLAPPRPALETVGRARFAFASKLRDDDALETLARDLPDRVELLRLNGAKVLYPEILALSEPRLRPGSLVLADNADPNPEFLDYVRNAVSGDLSVPFAKDAELFMEL